MGSPLSKWHNMNPPDTQYYLFKKMSDTEASDPIIVFLFFS